MWTHAASTTADAGVGRRRRLMMALAWTLIVSSLAAQVTWGWAMHRQGTEWMPDAVRVVLDRVDARAGNGRAGPTIRESVRP